MKYLIKTMTIIIILLIIWIPPKIEPCTFFCLSQGGTILVGKNLDWPIGDGFIIINKKGTAKQAMVESGERPAQWIAKFGSVTFNQFGKEFPLRQLQIIFP
jgi:choloylglycine hydrolase